MLTDPLRAAEKVTWLIGVDWLVSQDLAQYLDNPE